MAQPENVRNPLATDKVSVDAFAAGIKAKYPEYKEVDNNELVGAMLEKYPQYADQVEYYPSKKKDSTESPSTMVGEPTELVSQPQKETQENLGGPLVDSEKPVGFFESVSNSGKNIYKNLSLLDDKLNVLTDAAFTAVLGKETADSWFEWSSENLWGENVNESARKSLEEIQKVQETMGETRGILESVKKGDVVGVAAGTVDAIASLATSIIEGSILYGAPLAADMVGGSIANYNIEKAKTLGKDTTELWESDDAEILMPTITGALSYGLEKFGQGKLAKQLKGAFLKTEVGEQAAKNVTKFGSSRIGKAFMSNPNREGMTELTQGMIEQFSLSDARGESFDAIDYLTSEEAWEQYVMGAVGAKALELGGKGANRLMYGSTARTQEKQELKETIITAEEAIQDPETPADEKRELRKTQKEAAAKITKIQEEEAAIINEYSEKDKAELAEIDRELKKKEGVLKRSKKEETKKIHTKAIEELVARKKAIEGKYETEQTEQEAFVETGEVSDDTITTIATKVKDGEELTTEEQAIYQDKAQEVETKLKEFAAAEEVAPAEEAPVVEKKPKAKKAAPKKKAAKAEEVTYRNSTYVIGEDGTITNKKSGKVIAPTSVTAKGIQKARTTTEEAPAPVAAPVPAPVKVEAKPKAKKKAPAKVKEETPAKPKVDTKEVEAQKKVQESAPRKTYNRIKSPMLRVKRGYKTVVEKVDKRSGKVRRYEGEVFVNTNTGEVTHSITEYIDGKKGQTKEVKDAKGFIDAINKRIAQGAVVSETFQREFEASAKITEESEAEKAALERVVDFKEKKVVPYTQVKEKYTYESANGTEVSIELTTNIGDRDRDLPYATARYSDGRVQTFPAKSMLDKWKSNIAQRKNVKTEAISQTKKEKKKVVEGDKGYTGERILPEIGKRFEIKKPRKGRKSKLPNNTKPFKPIVARARTSFEEPVYRVYTPDGQTVYFERQITGEVVQVERVGNTDRYRPVKGAQEFDTVREANAALRQEYNAAQEAAAEKEAKKETPKKKVKEEPKQKVQEEQRIQFEPSEGESIVYFTRQRGDKTFYEKTDTRAGLTPSSQLTIYETKEKWDSAIKRAEKQYKKIEKPKEEPKAEAKGKLYKHSERPTDFKNGNFKFLKDYFVPETKEDLDGMTFENINDVVSGHASPFANDKFISELIQKYLIDSDVKNTSRKKLQWYRTYIDKYFNTESYKGSKPSDLRLSELMYYTVGDGNVNPSFSIAKESDMNSLREGFKKLGVDLDVAARELYLEKDYLNTFSEIKKERSQVTGPIRFRGPVRIRSRARGNNSRGISLNVIDKTISRANRILRVFSPDVVIVTHANKAEFDKAMDEFSHNGKKESVEGGRYIYNKKTGAREIHINIDAANERTAVHEAFHAYFDKYFNQDPAQAKELAKSLYRALQKGNKQDRAVARELARLINSYESDVRSEEFLAELAGIMSSAPDVLQGNSVVKVVEVIKKFILKAIEALGINGTFVEALRKDVDADMSEETAIEFLRGFVEANQESANAPEANALRDVNRLKMDERSELVQDLNLEGIVRNVFNLVKSRMAHRIDYDPEFHPKAYNLTETDIVGEDIYVTPQYYGDVNDKATKESIRVLNEIKGDPEAEVTIYRGIPKNGIEIIDQGAWVSFSKTYAKGEGDIVISQNVKAKDVVWGGDDFNEMAYYPSEKATDSDIIDAIQEALDSSEVTGITGKEVFDAVSISDDAYDAINLTMGAKERSQLVPDDADLNEQTKGKIEKNRRAKINSVREAYDYIKGLISSTMEKGAKEGLFYSETQKKITEFLEAMNSQLSRTAFRVRIQGRMLRKLADTPEKLAMVEEYLLASPEQKAEVRSRLEKMPNGEKIVAVADGMRTFIDGLSQKFLDSPYFDSLPEVANKKVESYVVSKGKDKGKTRYRVINTKTGETLAADLTKGKAKEFAEQAGLRDIIRNNLGSYLHTSYRFFSDKSFNITDNSKKAAIKGQYEAVRAAKLQELIKDGKTEKEAVEALKDPKLIAEMQETATKNIEDYIREIEALRADPEYKFSGLSAQAMKIPKPAFQRKKGLPDYIENLLGKERDPVNRFTNSALVMMQTFYKMQLVHKISNAVGGDYIKESITEEESASGNWKLVKDQYSPLNNKYVQVEIAEMLQSKPLLSSDNAIINFYFKGLKIMRKSKVVWNIPTWRKNWTGGFFFMATNGVINKNFVSDTKNRVDRLFKGMASEDVEALLDEMAENGLIGADVNAGLIDLNDAALGMMFTEEPIGKYEGKFKKYHKKLKNADARLAENYASVDDYTKLVIYRVEKESFSKKLYGKTYAELNEEQQAKVRREAAEFVKQNTPTFSRLPKWYTKGRIKSMDGKEISFAQLPLGDFLGFKLESIRSMYSNIKNAAADLAMARDKENGLSDIQRAEYKAAGQRRMAGAMAVLSMRAAIPTIAAAMFLDDDDEELAEDIVKLRPSWMEGHTLMVRKIDENGVARVFDYSMEDPYAELTDPLLGDFSMFEDFMKPNMLMSLLVHLSEGKDAYGRDLYEKADPAILKMAKGLGYTFKQTLVPPSVSAIAKYKNPTQLAIRDYEINVGQQFYFQAKEYVSSTKYTDLTGRARKNRLRALDEVREMYEATMRVAFAKGNNEMAIQANRVLNRFGKAEKAYIVSGYVVSE